MSAHDFVAGKLDALRRREVTESDARIFPGHYVPIIMERGERVVKPMRYECRPAGKPAFYDTKFPGTYIARRDSLGGYRKSLFNYSHGLLVATTFYEHVSKARLEQREIQVGERDENIVLEFKPSPAENTLMASLGPVGKEKANEIYCRSPRLLMSTARNRSG